MTVYRKPGIVTVWTDSEPLPSTRRQPVALVPPTRGDLPCVGEVILAATAEVLRVEP